MIVLKFIAGVILITLAIMVWNGMQSPSCERLYNEYSSTVDMSARDAIFQDGLESGCFHHE